MLLITTYRTKGNHHCYFARERRINNAIDKDTIIGPHIS